MPTRRPTPPVILLLLATLILLAPSPADAGTISLAWDPVEHPDLAGYRLYYGPSGGPLAESTGVTIATALTLSGLEDCTEYTIGVKAVDGDGVESPAYSNLVSGWSRPVPNSASQSTVEQDAEVLLTLGGTNFRNGATVVFSDPAITATGISVNDCQQITLHVSVGSEAALGPVELRVVNPDQVFGEATGLFSVVGDDSGPTISGLDADPVGATTATVVWTTDEPADGQVFFRLEGESTYQSTSVIPDLVAEHATVIHGLRPESTYEFHVTSADEAGNPTSSADETFTTLASEFTYLRFEAEAGTAGDPIDDATGDDAFSSGWIELAAQASPGTPSDPTGTTDYGVYVPYSGSWRVWVRVSSSVSAGSTWYERIDDETWAALESTDTTGVWTWVAGGTYELNEGLHGFGLGGQVPGSAADRVIVTDDLEFQPTEEPGDDTTAPNDFPAASVAPGNGSSFLSWTVPQDSDALTLVIRYRTDGRFPVSPVDGLPLVEMEVEPASSSGTTHDGQVNGTTYAYSLFAVDPSGNASDPANLESTPAAEPPPTVTNLRRTDTQ